VLFAQRYRNDHEQWTQSTMPMIVERGLDDVVHEAGTI
jgi:hypothetical protein